MDTQKSKNGFNYTITDHDIVSAVTVIFYGTDKVRDNVVKQVFGITCLESLECNFINLFCG